MAMGKRKRHRRGSLWVETARLAKGPAHPFYRRLNQILGQHGCDEYVERACQGFYADKLGRPSLPPAVYFRLVQAAAFNLGLLLRRRLGTGKPRGLPRAGLSSLWDHLFAWIAAWKALSCAWVRKLITSTPGCSLSTLTLDAARLA
jgi:hypothetical protein